MGDLLFLADSRCATCGHPRWRHNPIRPGRTGWGKCEERGCRCQRFVARKRKRRRIRRASKGDGDAA